MKDNLNWAVLGTGVIANEMAQTLQKMGKKLYAVGNRTHAKAVAFAEKYGIEMVYDCIDDMFLDEMWTSSTLPAHTTPTSSLWKRL